MKCHLIRWNPNTSSYKQKDFNSDFYRSKFLDGLDEFSWELNNKETIDYDDFWIILRVGTEKNGIAAFGYFSDYSEYSYNDEDSDDPFMDVFVMFNLDDYNYLSTEKLKEACPDFDWDKDTNDNEIVDIKYTAKFFPLIAKIFTDTHGITPFYSYSDENHPFIDSEIKDLAEIFCPDFKYDIIPWDSYLKDEKDDEPWISESYRLPKTSILILKSYIGTIIRKYWNYDEEGESKGSDFIFYDYSKFSLISKINKRGTDSLPAFTIVPEELNRVLKVLYEEIQEQEVNELLNDILVYTDKIYFKSKGSKEIHQIQIDIGIKFVLKYSELLVEKKTYESDLVYTKFYQLNKSPDFSIKLDNKFIIDDDSVIKSIRRVETSLATGSEKVIEEIKF